MIPEITPVSRDFRVRLAAYVGILSAYLAAVKSDPLTPLQLAFFAAAAGWSLFVEHRFRKPFFTSPIKIGLIVLGSLIFVYFVTTQAGAGTDHFANSIARFLFWNAIVFVLSRNKSDYDLWTLAIIELSLFMISGAFVQPPDFLPLLLLSAACFVYTFQRAALLRCGPAGEAERGGLGLAGFALLLSFEIAAIVFIAFPRAAFRMEKSPDASGAEGSVQRPDVASLAGGASTIGMPRNPQFLDLTNFDKLKSDHRPVLRITLSDEKGKPLPPDQIYYLRGAVLDTYEEGRWRASFRRLPRRDGDDGVSDGWTTLDAKPPAGRRIVRQHVETTALAGDLAFAVADPVRVGWPSARYDPAGILFHPSPPRGIVTYDVESAFMPITIPEITKELDTAPAQYLRVPAGLERLREIAKKQADKVSGRLHARARIMENYLQRNGFQYKLEPFIPAAGQDPVEHFLEKKEGYCVHFATALALLCRAAGVPARVATGFQLREPLEPGTYLVKNSDAHAWVEVWFGQEHGWRTYDATPAGASDPVAAGPRGPDVPTGDERTPEAQGPPKTWDQIIRDFDPSAQGRALDEALGAAASAVAGAARFLVSLEVLGTLLGALLLAVLVYAVLPAARRRRLRQLVGRFPEQSIVPFYRDFLWALSLQGVRKDPALTAREFARSARGRLDEPGIDFVTDRFYAAAYGRTPPTPEELSRIEAIIRRIQSAAPRPA